MMKFATIALWIGLLAGCATGHGSGNQVPQDLHSLSDKTLFLPAGTGEPRRGLDYQKQEIAKAKIIALARVVPSGEWDYYYVAEVLKDQTGTVKAGDMVARWVAGAREATFHKWRVVFLEETGKRSPNGSATPLHEEPWPKMRSLPLSQFRELVKEVANQSPQPTRPTGG